MLLDRCSRSSDSSDRRWLRAAAIAAAILVAPIAASALSFSPTISFEVVGGSGATTVGSSGNLTTSGAVSTWTLSSPMVVGGTTINSWTAQLKEDPFVTNNINVTNTTLATQTFIAIVLLPIPAFAYNEVIASSIGITATDSNGNAILSFAQNAGTAIYQGRVNGSTILPLTPPNVPLTLADCGGFIGAGCSAVDATGVASLGVAPGVATSLSIALTFDLSPGDSAGITSRFEVVPEPSTALLLGAGLALLAGRHRSRLRDA